MRKDWKSCESGEIGHFESSWANSVGKDWKNCKSVEIGHSKSFWATSVGKDWKSCELGKIGHSKSLWATMVGKVWKSCNSDKIQLFWGGGVHHQEQQCHVDPKFQVNLKNRGFLFSVFHKLQMYVCNEGEGGRLVKCTCWPQLFSIAFMFISILLGGGGVHQPEPKCHLDLKSNFINLGGGVNRKSTSTFPILGGVHWKSTLTCFNFSNPGGGVTSAGRSKKCKVYG